MYPSYPVITNLKHYICYVAKLSNWEIHDFGELILVINGSNKSLFNYVFCQEDIKEYNEKPTKTVLSYLYDRKIEATWPVENHMINSISMFKNLGLQHVSTPKKALINISNYQILKHDFNNLQFEIVNNEHLLQTLDQTTSKIFYHDYGDVITFLRGLSNYDSETSKLKFFLVKLNGIVVSVCGMYIQDHTVGFYSDGVLSEYRNRGIASEMVLHRIKIAQKYNCKYAIAHCMKPSVNLYKRLGFKILGNLYLYTSSIKSPF